MAPSVKLLESNFPDKGFEIRQLIDGKKSTRSYESVRKWLEQCHNEPTLTERRMCALNEILEGHGVEAIFHGSDPMHPDAVYVNMGETYAATILYDYRSGTFKVTSWGDWVEKQERRGRRYG